MFQEAILVFEKALLKKHRKIWNRKERWKKEMLTRFGSLEMGRYRVWNREQRTSRYPLDEALGAAKWNKDTKEFRNIVVNQSVQRSYRQSRAKIVNQTGEN